MPLTAIAVLDHPCCPSFFLEAARYKHVARRLAALPDGLGTDVDMLKRMCHEDDEALRLLREEVTGDPGGDQRSEEATKTDNISNEDTHGSSKDYTLDRLAREDAYLYERVVPQLSPPSSQTLCRRHRADPETPPARANSAASMYCTPRLLCLISIPLSV